MKVNKFLNSEVRASKGLISPRKLKDQQDSAIILAWCLLGVLALIVLGLFL